MNYLPTLETERLYLRRFELADAETVQRLVSDRRIAQTTLNIPHPYPEGGALEWINSGHKQIEERRIFPFAVERKAGEALMGAITLSMRRDGHQAEMGYWIGVPFWGHGYMTEAAQRLIRFGFEELGLNRIMASHFVSNPASGRVMQKAGMTFEGIMKGHVFRWGQAHDLCWYGILRAEVELNEQEA